MDITREVTHRGLASPDSLHIDDPRFVPHLPVDLREVLGVLLLVACLDEPADAVAERTPSALTGKSQRFPFARRTCGLKRRASTG